MIEPIITVRFSDPKYNPELKTYTVNVDFKSNTVGQKLYGMNVRFFYDATYMTFTTFKSFAAGYGKYSPNPPKKSIIPEPLLGFEGMTIYINGAVAVKNKAIAPVIPVDGWITLFKIEFSVIEQPANPPLVWDRQKDVQIGFITGSSGICITLTGLSDWGTITTKELAEQFNWTYTDPPNPPYGHPIRS